MDYALIKTVHVSSVIASLSLFGLRGYWMLHASHRLAQRWVRILPHLIDTLLLASAITLVVLSHQYPFVEPWLTAKVVALLLYIGLGMIALRRGRTRQLRTVAWLSALLVFGYIVAVARTRDPWLIGPWL